VTTEKVYLSSWVTLELIQDAVALQSMFDLERWHLAKWAADNGYALLPGIRVYFEKPDYERAPLFPDSLHLKVIGRAAKITALEKIPIWGTECFALC
jgi:hypothetical protein